MATSYRHLLRGVHGRVRANFNCPEIMSRQAVVHITASEVIFGGGTSEVIGPRGGVVSQEYHYQLGEAEIWVTNVSPHYNDHFEGEPGGVEYYLHINWKTPLDVAVTITVDEATPVGID